VDRRLIRERWMRDKERPTTEMIQETLYRQIRGFDISESALRLAALALYITAIELNGSPRPPESLKFPRNLRGEVLHRFGGGEPSESGSIIFPLGSLGTEVPDKFKNQHDIVIGNPPWTRIRDCGDDSNKKGDQKVIRAAIKTLNKEFSTIARRVLSNRGLPGLASSYENPDNNPDLPFLWRAMEWAKEDGIIALAMPARLFGRTTGVGFAAWSAVLESVQITGLINGSDLRWTSVWKSIKAPFCLFVCPQRHAGSGTPLLLCNASQ
jgi:hypothetical protein